MKCEKVGNGAINNKQTSVDQDVRREWWKIDGLALIRFGSKKIQERKTTFIMEILYFAGGACEEIRMTDTYGGAKRLTSKGMSKK